MKKMFRPYSKLRLGAEPGRRRTGRKREEVREKEIETERTERNQNPPTGNRAKLFFSLYGKNSPKSHRIALGVELKSC